MTIFVISGHKTLILSL